VTFSSVSKKSEISGDGVQQDDALQGIPRANNSGIVFTEPTLGTPGVTKLKMKTPITKAAKEAGSSETPKR